MDAKAGANFLLLFQQGTAANLVNRKCCLLLVYSFDSTQMISGEPSKTVIVSQFKSSILVEYRGIAPGNCKNNFRAQSTQVHLKIISNYEFRIIIISDFFNEFYVNRLKNLPNLLKSDKNHAQCLCLESYYFVKYE